MECKWKKKEFFPSVSPTFAQGYVEKCEKTGKVVKGNECEECEWRIQENEH